MNTFRTAAELEADEKLGEEELQEARATKRDAALGIVCFGGVAISHKLQPVAAVCGDFPGDFRLAVGAIGLSLKRCLRKRAAPRLSNCAWVFNQECSDCASSAGFPIDRLNALQ